VSGAESTVACISDEVQAIANLQLPALRRAWAARWGDMPAFRSRDLMARALAYRLQAEALGDLPAPMKRRAAEYAGKFGADRRFTPTPGLVLKPGCSLVREWKGLRHEVAVTADGFTYAGEHFGSLSKVAQKITGTKWNGHVFFGLKGRGGKGG
jgi:hypothetical protein